MLKQGVIAEEGTHDELVALDGAYKKLVDRQLVETKIKEIDQALNAATAEASA